ncbi:hypothetical protein HN295_20140, partial [Acinetobacter baumannii]|uniref:T6SS effector amidase Tae4 family protein n=1 Tax=Acinetobacter baumannii TaxID=470 RepID=UPI001F54E77C
SLLNDSDAMSAQFKERVRTAKAWLDSKLANRKGIVVFDVAGWGDATGHFTLWDGSRLAYAEHHDDPTNNDYYFWLTQLNQDSSGRKFLVQVISVKFWELK